MKNVVVTGVSTGVGYAIARDLVENRYRVFGSVRKKNDAKRLKEDLGENLHPLLLDVTNRMDILRACETVREEIGEESLAALINNAGTAIYAPIMEQDIQDFRNVFEVNFFGMIQVTQAFLPLLGADENFEKQPGKVVNVSSLLGLSGCPFASGYSASKHAIQGFTDSLRQEMMVYGIDAVTVNPGHAPSALFTKIREDCKARLTNSRFASPYEKFLDLSFYMGENGLTIHFVG